jgi:hypothetical protein
LRSAVLKIGITLTCPLVLSVNKLDQSTLFDEIDFFKQCFVHIIQTQSKKQTNKNILKSTLFDDKNSIRFLFY